MNKCVMLYIFAEHFVFEQLLIFAVKELVFQYVLVLTTRTEYKPHKILEIKPINSTWLSHAKDITSRHNHFTRKTGYIAKIFKFFVRRLLMY